MNTTEPFPGDVNTIPNRTQRNFGRALLAVVVAFVAVLLFRAIGPTHVDATNRPQQQPPTATTLVPKVDQPAPTWNTPECPRLRGRC